jgi:hypothetical protein
MDDNKQKRRVNIYFKGEVVESVIFDSFTSEITEKSFFFMSDGVTVAIVPFDHLIIFSNQL